MMTFDKKALIIRKIYAIGEKSVEFLHGETICPVCQYFKIVKTGSVKVISTKKNVRYCECEHCGTRFKAVSEKKSVKITEKKTKEAKTVINKKKSKEKAK